MFIVAATVFTLVDNIYANLSEQKNVFYIRKEFNAHQHGRRFIVLEHQYGRCDVMWIRSPNIKRKYTDSIQSNNRKRFSIYLKT